MIYGKDTRSRDRFQILGSLVLNGLRVKALKVQQELNLEGSYAPNAEFRKPGDLYSGFPFTTGHSERQF